jgi:hypothetical protein
MNAKKYDFAVYGTQGGGLVRENPPGVFTFVEAPPDGFGLKVGDKMPVEWCLAPANELARAEVNQEQFGDEIPEIITVIPAPGKF